MWRGRLRAAVRPHAGAAESRNVSPVTDVQTSVLPFRFESMFMFRPLRPADVPGCVALMRDDGARGALLDAALIARLLQQRRLVARAFEEVRADGGALCCGRTWPCSQPAACRLASASATCRATPMRRATSGAEMP